MRNILMALITLMTIGCKESEVNVQADASVTCSRSGSIFPISYTGNDNRSDYPLSNLMDDKTNTFWQTNSMSSGDVKYVAFQFSPGTNLSEIEACDLYTMNYNLGDLEIFVSSNSTNGVDGTWTSIATQTASSNLYSSGRARITAAVNNITWIKFVMTYNGSGAFGGSPSFYLSEIVFK